MTCEQCREILSAALDGEAVVDETRAAERHVAGCDGCRRFRDETAEDRALLATWPDELPDPAVLRAPRRTPAGSWAAAAALVLALAIGFVVGRASGPGDAPAAALRTTESTTETAHPQRTVYPDDNEIHVVSVLADADPTHARLD